MGGKLAAIRVAPASERRRLRDRNRSDGQATEGPEASSAPIRSAQAFLCGE